LLGYIKLLADHPEVISVEIHPLELNYDEVTIYAHSEDIGKLIGKQGRMISAIKTVISGCKSKNGKNYRVNVKPIQIQ